MSNQYNRYTTAKEGQLPPGERQPGPTRIPISGGYRPVAYGASLKIPSETETFGRTVSNAVQRGAKMVAQAELIQYGVTGSWKPGFQRDGSVDGADNVNPLQSARAARQKIETRDDRKAWSAAIVERATGRPVSAPRARRRTSTDIT